MTLSVIERFKSRDRRAAEIKVEFFPASCLRHYCEVVIGEPTKALSELSEAQKADARERFHELTFYFNQLARGEREGFFLDLGMTVSRAPSEAMSLMRAKLASLFRRAEHHPKEGEAIAIGKEQFSQLLAEMDFSELNELMAEYRSAAKDEEERAVKNVLTAGLNGMPQSSTD